MGRHGRASVCPHCGSADVRLAEKDEEPDQIVVLRAYRACRQCGKVFQPASALCNGVVRAVVGMVTCILCGFELAADQSIPHLIIFGCCLLGGSVVLGVGCRDLIRGLRKAKPDNAGRPPISGA